MLHETLDPAVPRMVGIAHSSPDFGLQIKGEPLFGAAGQIMEMAPDRPQKPLGPREPLRFLSRQHAQIDKLADIVDAIDVLRQPEQRVEVPEPALALLDVRLELVTAVADTPMPFVALGELGFDELRCCAAHDFGVKTPFELVKERLLAPQVARLEQPCANGQIGFGLSQAFRDRAGRLTDLYSEIPQQVEQVLDNLLGMRGLLIGQ